MFLRLVQRVIVVCLIVGGISLGWRMFAQSAQSGGLTPPPKPSTPKVEKPAATLPDVPPFVVGERLSYNVSWARFVSAARLETEVVERGAFFGQAGYQLRAKVETTSDVRSIFFEMYNQYTTYASDKTLLPYRLENAVRQGAKQSDETLVFNQHAREIRYPDESILTVPANTYDFTSLLYALRKTALAEGNKQGYSVVYGKQLIELEVEVKKRERAISQAGSYNAVRVDLTPKDKQFSKYRARVWFSDDSQRLPIIILAQLPFGEVRAELSNATLALRGVQPTIQTNPISESGENPPGIEKRVLPFDLGERLNYEIVWGNFTSVGRASFEVRQKGYIGERRVFEFAAEAASIGAARAVISVNDQLISYADAETLEPVKTDTRLREGRRVKQVIAEYDWGSKQAKLPNGTLIAIPPGTLDLLSLFYAIRAAELKIGTIQKFSFLDANHRLHGVAVRANKTEVIGGVLGAREALQLDVLSPDKTQLIAQAWVSNDARRLPLYIATRTRFGELRFQLASVINPR